MSNHRSIIPEFMAQNPNDTFKLLLPLKLVLVKDKFGNSHFDVVIKNITKNEVFSYELSPELLFTHFPIEKSFLDLKATDFPEPVAPAMSRCGIFSISATDTLPPISFPTQKEIFEGWF